jgi:multiple antibiotic resistance protein
MFELISLKITNELLQAIVGIFVIVDPIGSVGIFLAVTNGFTQIKKEKAARFAGITVAAVLVLAALMGQAILDLFGIRLAAFSVAGGILFLILAVSNALAFPIYKRSMRQSWSNSIAKSKS